MKFKDIKEGDTVYIETDVRFDFSSWKSFFVPKKVIRVTNTQFIIEGGIRFRKDGGQIGEFKHAYTLGDTIYGYSNKKVCDQTKEMQEFKLKINIEYELKKQIESIRIERDSDLTLDELKIIQGKINEIKEIIKTN